MASKEILNYFIANVRDGGKTAEVEREEEVEGGK
jgi:hypothetical protein